MKKVIIASLGFVLMISAANLSAAPPVLALPHGGGHSGAHPGGGHGGFHGGHGGFHGGHGGFHGGHGGFHGGRVVVLPSWGWGWGWGWGGWYGYGSAYWGGGYYGPGGYYGVGAYSDWTIVDTDVSPDEARVFLDGRYIGTADDFDGYPDYLYLRGGRYKLEFRLDGYETKVVEVDARPGSKLDINDKLHKVPGAKQYGSYDTPTPQGGVQRYYARKSDGSDAVGRPDAEPGGPSDGSDEWGQDSYGDRQRSEDRPAPPANNHPGSGSEDWRDRPNGSGDALARPDSHVRSTRLTIHAEPSDAAVYLDDRFVGTGEEVSGQLRGLRVSPGRHNVTVSRPGFKDRTVSVDVASGRTEEVEIDLDR